MALIAASVAVSALAVGLSVLVLASRSSQPSSPADIVGTITRIDDSSGSRRVLIEEDPSKDWGGNKLLLSIKSSTAVFVQDRLGTHKAAAADLKTGQHVKAWVDGPILESYPGQAGASAIVILG